MMQIKRNIPHVHNFAATAAASTVQWIGPDYEVTATAPALVSHGSNRYTVAPIATEYGEWLLAVYDGSSNLIHQERFACVAGTDREVELGMDFGHGSSHGIKGKALEMDDQDLGQLFQGQGLRGGDARV